MKLNKISTLQGYIFIIVMITILAVLTGSHFFYYILVLMIVNLVMMFLIVQQNEKKMLQFLYINEEEVSVGDTLRVDFKTNNTGIFPIAHAKINCTLFNKYNKMTFPSDNIFFNPYQIINIREKFEIKTRGIFTNGKIVTKYYDPLKMFKREKVFEKQIELVVYPKIHELDYLYMPSTGYIGTKKTSKSAHEDYSSLKKVRKYANGDSYKRIHWKLSSKRGELYVKEYDSTSSTKVTVILDAFKMHYENDIDRMLEDKVVEIAASIIKYVLRSNADTTMIYNSDHIVRVDSRDLSTFPNVLKELVTFVSEGTMDFSQLVTQETKTLEQGSFVIMITTQITNELIDTILGLKRRSFTISLIVVEDNNSEDNKKVLLQSIGAKVYSVESKDDIKSKLEDLSV